MIFDELVPFFVASFLMSGSFGLFYGIDKFKTHLNFLGAFLITMLGMGVIFGIVILFIKFIDAICPKCYKYSPKFVWSYGYTRAHKHLCEKCCSSRIKEVFGDNLAYIEDLAKERKLV